MAGSTKDGQVPARKTARNASRLSLATEEKMTKLLKARSCPLVILCGWTDILQV